MGEYVRVCMGGGVWIDSCLNGWTERQDRHIHTYIHTYIDR